MINATQIRRGMLIILEGQLFRVLEATHVTPGRWKAMMQTKLRNIKDGSLLNYRFRSEDRVEQARISEDMNRSKLSNISVIQPAAVPVKPVHPNKKLNMLLSLLIGCLSALGIAFSSEHLSQGLTTPDGAERRLGLPVLAAISLKET